MSHRSLSSADRPRRVRRRPRLLGQRALTELREVIAELVAAFALNTSDRSRNPLLYEVAAADAWPLLGVADIDEFNRGLLSGRSTLEPRVTSVPVRLPLPPAARQGSIDENQASATRFYFEKPTV